MQQQVEEELPETRRKEIFLALVHTQDKRVAVARSRQVVAGQFGVSLDLIREIEEEGLDNEWPPL